MVAEDVKRLDLLLLLRSSSNKYSTNHEICRLKKNIFSWFDLSTKTYQFDIRINFEFERLYETHSNSKNALISFCVSLSYYVMRD